MIVPSRVSSYHIVKSNEKIEKQREIRGSIHMYVVLIACFCIIMCEYDRDEVITAILMMYLLHNDFEWKHIPYQHFDVNMFLEFRYSVCVF